MTKIEGITDDANQLFLLTLPDGSVFQMTLQFIELQQGWFMSLVYGDFQANNIRVCCVLNILEQFTNLLPFGITCITSQNQEPFFIEDFQAQNAALCILDSVDLAAIEAFYAS